MPEQTPHPASKIEQFVEALIYQSRWLLALLYIGLMASLAAISGIYLLEALLNLASQTWVQLAWKLGIHLTFVVSGVFFALMERTEAAAGHGGPPAE